MAWRPQEKKVEKPVPLVVADAVAKKRFPVTNSAVRQAPAVNIPQPIPGQPTA